MNLENQAKIAYCDDVLKITTCNERMNLEAGITEENFLTIAQAAQESPTCLNLDLEIAKKIIKDNKKRKWWDIKYTGISSKYAEQLILEFLEIVQNFISENKYLVEEIKKLSVYGVEVENYKTISPIKNTKLEKEGA